MQKKVKAPIKGASIEKGKKNKHLKVNNKNLNYKKQQKRAKVKKVASILFVIILCITAVILFLLSPIFNITEILVEGNEQISTNEIVSLSGIEKGTNIYKMSSKQITENIQENKYISDVKISRKLPSTILLTIKERKPEFYIEFGGSFAYIDKQGYIVELTLKTLEDKPKLLGYKTSEEKIIAGNTLCEEDIENISEILKILNVAETYSLKERITSINISDSSNYVLYLQSENKTVNLGTTEKVDTKMMYLQSIIEKEKGTPRHCIFRCRFQK